MKTKKINGKEIAESGYTKYMEEMFPQKQHTPTPWIQDGTWAVNDDNDTIFKATTAYDAEFIVHAVNSHEALLNAVKYALKLSLIEKEDAIKKGDMAMNIAAIQNEIDVYKNALKLAEDK